MHAQISKYCIVNVLQYLTTQCEDPHYQGPNQEEENSVYAYLRSCQEGK